MKTKRLLVSTSLLFCSACATLNESLELGATTGGLAGAAAMYTAEASTGQPPRMENVAVGAGIGIGVGLLTSYIMHRNVESNRNESRRDDMEMHFGDLPPSPFVRNVPYGPYYLDIFCRMRQYCANISLYICRTLKM